METQEEKVVDIQEAVQKEMQDWGLTEVEPIEPREQIRYKFTRRREKDYYHSINWAEWWDEFNGARLENGKRKYEVVSDFIKAKTEVVWQRTLLQHCIGPEPKDKEVREVPYLGNWQKIRRNGFYVFDDPAKARAVSIALEQKAELIEATRSLAPMIAKRLAYWYRIKDMITEGLIGKLMDEDTYKAIKLKSGKTKKFLVESRAERLESFLKWQFKVEEMIAKLQEQWMLVHGVNPQDVGQQWSAMAVTAGQVGAAAALTGVAAAKGIPGRPTLTQDGVELPLPAGMTYDAMLFADHLKDSEQRYGLVLPETEAVKANGKSKAKSQ